MSDKLLADRRLLQDATVLQDIQWAHASGNLFGRKFLEIYPMLVCGAEILNRRFHVKKDRRFTSLPRHQIGQTMLANISEYFETLLQEPTNRPHFCIGSAMLEGNGAYTPEVLGHD